MANKILLNSGKTELIFLDLKTKKKQKQEVRISGQKINII